MNPIYKFELNRPTVNLLNPKTAVWGLLSTSNGQITSSTIYRSSDFIPVTPGTNYKLCDKDTFTSIAAPAACFYTANKTFISGSYGIANTPSNAAYMRVSFQGPGEDWGVFPSNVSYWSEYITPIAYPVYKDDLAKDFEKESNQEFFRAKLSGNLSFVGPDYDWIVGRAFDFQFVITVFISYNAGQTWTEYWRGTFWKTDCDFDDDAKTVSVKPTVWDQYNDVLAGMDKEYNLIELAPEIVPVKADKRPMIQVYVPGQTVIGCFLSGMWWEQECERIWETDTVEIEGQAYPALEYKYHFRLNKSFTHIEISGTMTPQLPDSVLALQGKYFDFTVGNFIYRRVYGGTSDAIAIYDANTGIAQWTNSNVPVDLAGVYTVTLSPVSGEQSTGDVTLNITTLGVYARYITDIEENTYPIPDDDIVENNRNYSRVTGYYVPNTILISDTIVNFPTKWGIYQPGQYYFNPADSPSAGIGEAFPIARSTWGLISIWFAFSLNDWATEQQWRKEYMLKDAFPIWSVISVLLDKVAPGITHDGTTDYSQFLYGNNPITHINQYLFITPKSNVITAGYDQPAQKAPITLKRVTDMLRDCFRCYWFIDNQNRFRIEHISWFMNGGAYPGTPDFPKIGINLTKQIVTRNGKPWAYARNQYEFDKPEMAARYQFGWMDDVTELFEGHPIDIVSKYVNQDNIEQIDVSQFTSDVDYILLNPGAVSKDGFVLLGAKKSGVEIQNSAVADTDSTTRFECIITGNFFAGESIDVQMSNANGILSGNMAQIRDDTDEQIGVVSGNSITTITLPRNTTEIRVTRDITGVIGNGSITITIIKMDEYKLPYINFVQNNANHILQNAYVAFVYLQRYYFYDMPAKYYSINGETFMARGIKKLKRQTINFPVLMEPDMFNLIKTGLGNGTIQKMSVNLSSRNASTTLKYDTK